MSKIERGHVSKIIKSFTKLNLKQFCELVLNSSYCNFNYRSAMGKVHLLDYLTIREITGQSLDQLIVEDPRNEPLLQIARERAKAIDQIEPEAPKPKAPKSMPKFRFEEV